MTKTLLIAAAICGMAGSAFAGQPANPGGFGQDRAAVIHGMQDGSSTYSTGAPGASEWGAIAGQRAGDNGQINQQYRNLNGDTPTNKH